MKENIGYNYELKILFSNYLKWNKFTVGMILNLGAIKVFVGGIRPWWNYDE